MKRPEYRIQEEPSKERKEQNCQTGQHRETYPYKEARAFLGPAGFKLYKTEHPATASISSSLQDSLYLFRHVPACTLFTPTHPTLTQPHPLFHYVLASLYVPVPESLSQTAVTTFQVIAPSLPTQHISAPSLLSLPQDQVQVPSTLHLQLPKLDCIPTDSISEHVGPIHCFCSWDPKAFTTNI